MIEVVGVITARGGSKGTPRKNVRKLAGKPLIAWTIEAAHRSESLSRVIVSTDDDEITQVCRAWGAEVPFRRPAELARDDSSSIAVLRHAAEWIERTDGRAPDYVMLLQPTSPLRRAEDIEGAVELAQARDAQAVVSVTETRHHPYLCRRIDEAGRLVEFMPCPVEYPRRQDIPTAYALNGAIYLIRPARLAAPDSRVFEGALGFVMPPERSLDVDTPWDLAVAETALRGSLPHGVARLAPITT